MKRIRLFLFGFFLLSSTPSFAYNFLHIHPTTGKPIGWEPGTVIHYYLDPGPLGSLSNEQAHTLLKEAMKIWENASPNANPPKFEFAGYLPEDVDGTNYQQYVGVGQCYSADLTSCPTDSQKNLQTVIIFDQGDSILDNALCKITPCVASAGARVFSGSSADPGNILQGVAVFGSASTGAIVNETVGTFVHELGHLLGLAHTYLNQQSFGQRYFPTMMGMTPISGATPTPDDIAGVSALYPLDSFATETATIKGQILKSDGAPMQYVNVIARNTEDPLCQAYSFLSGRICPDGTTMSPTGACFANDDSGLVETGEFTISGLPPATYSLEVEEVADESLSLTLAPGFPLVPIEGDAEFWNDGDAAGDPSNLTSSTITLAPGETHENVDIILNRSEITADRIKFIPTDTFTPGPGTLCPEKPPVDYAAMIGIDETPPGGGSSTGSGGCSLIQ